MKRILKYDPDHHQNAQNYLILLVALVLLILIPPVAAQFNMTELAIDICISFVIITGIYITTETRSHLRTGLVLGVFTLLIRWLCLIQESPAWGLLFSQSMLGLLFFSFISYHLARSIIKTPSITVRTIYGAIAGFMILGLISGQLFTLLELCVPDSLIFNGEETAFDYMYFSYVILTGIGFGDIVPGGVIAKSLSVLIGILGQVYLTVLIAILIGKFLSEPNKNHHESY